MVTNLHKFHARGHACEYYEGNFGSFTGWDITTVRQRGPQFHLALLPMATHVSVEDNMPDFKYLHVDKDAKRMPMSHLK